MTTSAMPSTVSAQQSAPMIPAQVQRSIDHDAFWVLVARLKEAKEGADYRAKSEALVEYIQQFAKNFSVLQFGQPMTKKEVDDIVYRLRQNGNDTTYEIVNAALAQRSKSEPVVLDAKPSHAADFMPGDLVYKAEDVQAMRQAKSTPAMHDAMRGARCLVKVAGMWTPARFVATDLVGGEPIVQEPGKMPIFATWDNVQFVAPRPAQLLSHSPQTGTAPAMVVTNGDSTVYGCDWDSVPPGVYYVYPAPAAPEVAAEPADA